jgi:hypothetical protein
MIVVKVELHSAVTGEVKTLGTAVIDNITDASQHRITGGRLGNYRARVWRKGAETAFAGDHPTAIIMHMMRGKKAQREGGVEGHRRLAEPIWTLVRKALESMRY